MVAQALEGKGWSLVDTSLPVDVASPIIACIVNIVTALASCQRMMYAFNRDAEPTGQQTPDLPGLGART